MRMSGSPDRRNPDHLWGLVHVEPFPHCSDKMVGRWYVIKYGQMASQNKFLHVDGSWHDTAGYEGSWCNDLAARTAARSAPGGSGAEIIP